jgi:hypothetical protein
VEKMNQLYPKIAVFFIALSVLVGGTIVLFSSVSLLETFGNLSGIVVNTIKNTGQAMGKSWMPS